jgi:hypothetical protein
MSGSNAVSWRKWFWKNYLSLREEYPDEYVAIRNCQVIARSPLLSEVLEHARKLVGSDDFIVEFVESGEFVVL